MTWRDPPPLADLGKAEWTRSSDRVIGMSRVAGVSNADLGWAAERAVAVITGWRREGGSTEFDLVDDETRTAWEVKACSVFAGEYKMKLKRSEVLAKLAAAARRGLRPGSIIAVVDEADVAWAYARDGIGSFRLTGPERGWRFLGSQKL